MQLANQEAQRFNHEYIGTEHILLGLVKEGTGVAANVLKNLDIDLRKIRLEVESELADALLRGDVRDGDKVVMSYDALAHAVLVQKQAPGAEVPSGSAKEPAHA